MQIVNTLLKNAGLIVLGCVLMLAPVSAEELAYTADFRLQDCTFSTRSDNPYFILQPGHSQILEGESDGEHIRIEQKVLWKTRRLPVEINGRMRWIKTRILESIEYIDGELYEVANNYYARCRETNSVYYFGEDVDFYEDGEIVNHDGSWLAGEGGAQPGLIMPGTFLVGARYYQEFAPGIAEDQGENIAMGLTVSTPAGEFTDCVEVLDTNPLELESEGDLKVYCPGIGLIKDVEIGLVDYRLSYPFPWYLDND
ncbi:MAG: hypothetical protein KDK04_22510 [Candidatus Competibacteraceae bacterium]|nr:hypothetical protein [Candidatus Competibacteraceae bacterium]MCB1805135.1 hypothetical protein [Candidatus Competibacteraceae bacterium]MCB1814468.1 hypothetical protein [Candidatus Competibacteraceae bacterium]